MNMLTVTNAFSLTHFKRKVTTPGFVKQRSGDKSYELYIDCKCLIDGDNFNVMKIYQHFDTYTTYLKALSFDIRLLTTLVNSVIINVSQ